jgi:WD40 repeat protein
VAFSPDGKTVLTVGSWAQLWDAATGMPRGVTLTGHVTAVAFSPDGKTILTGGGIDVRGHNGGEARLCDAVTGMRIGTPMTHQATVTAVAFSPDGKTVLTGSWDTTAQLWDAATGKPRGAPLTHQGEVYVVAFSPDGKTVLTGTSGETVRLWDAATSKPLGPPQTNQGTGTGTNRAAAAFSPDSRTVLIGGRGSNARLWDVSELPDDLPRVAAWVEVITGLRLDQEGTVHVLNSKALLKSRELLEQLGGPPETGVRR